MPRPSDHDGLVAIAIDQVGLAIEDYLVGPGRGRGAGALEQQQNYASAEAFLHRVGLLARVHERHGTPAYLSIGHDQQLELF